MLLKQLSKFLSSNFNELELPGKSENDIDRSLAALDDNYFLRYEGIPDMVVYTGWPKELKNRSRIYSMKGYIFISSSYKMGEYPEGAVESALFLNLIYSAEPITTTTVKI